MQCLAEEVSLSSKLVLSIYDFGGQSVFSVIHHLFLIRNGFYLVVFNMEEFLSPDPVVSEACKAEIRFWVNSITIHTIDEGTKEAAPYAFVGTHRDSVCPSRGQREREREGHEEVGIEVQDIAVFSDISKELNNMFGSVIAWNSRVLYSFNLGNYGITISDDNSPSKSSALSPAPVNLNFFPVDNKMSYRDPAVQSLKAEKSSEYRDNKK